MNNSLRSQVVLIAGMHRSGTSALTKTLSLLGGDLPVALLPPMEGINSKGFWESVELVDLHEALLKSAGSNWMDWSLFNPEWYQSGVAKSFQHQLLVYLEKDFKNSPLFVIKDPRICKFLPFWFDTLDAFKADPIVIIPVRHPLEVAYSLLKRDGMPVQKALLLWLRYVLDAVHYSSDKVRAFVCYDDLLTDWKYVIKSIARQTNLYLPSQSPLIESEIDSYIDQGYKNNKVDPLVIREGGEVHSIIGEAYDALIQLSGQSVNRTEPLKVLSDIRIEFNKTSSLYAKLFLYEESLAMRLKQQSDILKSDIKNLTSTVGELNSTSERLNLALKQASSERGQLRAELGQVASERDQLRAELGQVASERDQLRVELGQVASERDQLRVELNQVGSERDQLKNSLNQSEAVLRSSLAENNRWTSVVIPRLQQGIIESSEAGRGMYGLSGQTLPSLLSWFGKRKKYQECYSIIKKSQLFDEEFYAGRYLDSEKEVEDCIAHYLDVGVCRGYDPNPLFSSTWYLSCNTDVYHKGENPLVHFILYGSDEGRSCHPLFDVKWYIESNNDLKDLGVNPLNHYLQYGYKEGRAPCLLFDGSWYSLEYQLDENINPLIHFIETGDQQGFSPHPFFHSRFFKSKTLSINDASINSLVFYIIYAASWGYDPHPLFDSDFYKRQAISTFSSIPLIDFLSQDFGKEVSPSPLFDSKWYLENHSGVVELEINPLVHYLKEGSSLNFDPNLLFDTSWYREIYEPELDQPLVDFVMGGFAKGRNPNPWFDSLWYMEQDPVLWSCKGNPLSHYLCFGAKEGRNTHPELNLSDYFSDYPDMENSDLTPLGYYVKYISTTDKE